MDKTYQPAAIEQLKTLASQVDVKFHPSTTDAKPVSIATAAVSAARAAAADVLIVDTAGRLHIDAAMMAEIQAIHGAIKPHETLFVVDSMTGQDAANTAKAFNDALPLTGVVLNKTDGDARGGAALSVRHITGKPVKFIVLLTSPIGETGPHIQTLAGVSRLWQNDAFRHHMGSLDDPEDAKTNRIYRNVQMERTKSGEVPRNH